MTAVTSSSELRQRFSPQSYINRICILFICGYFLFEALWITFVSNGAGLDDAEQLANISFFDWGYGGSQPPLYTWICIIATKLFGTHLLTIQMVKFTLLASLFLSVYGALRKLGFSALVAAAGMFGMFLLPQIGWESQRALSHSVLGTAGCGWTFYAFACYLKRPNQFQAVLLGLAITVALQGKFNAALFIVALFLAGFTIANYREELLSRTLLVTPVITLITMAPTLIWMLLHKGNVMARTGKFEIGASGNALLDRFTGLSELIAATLFFTIIALAIAGAVILLAKKQASPKDYPLQVGPLLDGERLLINSVLIGLLLVLIPILLTGATNIKDRWLQPILFITPAIFANVLARCSVGNKAVRLFALTGFITALIIPPVLTFYVSGISARIGATFPHIFVQDTPPSNQLDYQALYKEVSKYGNIGQIFADRPHLAGNLRLLDPSIQVLHLETPDIKGRLEFPFLVMWTGNTEMPIMLHYTLLMTGIVVRHDIHSIDIGYLSDKNAPKLTVYYSYYPAL